MILNNDQKSLMAELIQKAYGDNDALAKLEMYTMGYEACSQVVSTGLHNLINEIEVMPDTFGKKEIIAFLRVRLFNEEYVDEETPEQIDDTHSEG